MMLMAVALRQDDRRHPVRERLVGLIERTSPGAMAHERVLPVGDVLDSVLPAGLRRGSSLATGGPLAVSLALAACAEASRQGSWTAVIGLDDLGWAAAAEHGVVLDRCIAIARPAAPRWAEIVAVAAEGADLVVTCRPPHLTPGQIRRIQSRLTTTGTVLIVVDERWSPDRTRVPGGAGHQAGEAGSGPGGDWSADVRLTARVRSWEGIGTGHGRLVARRVVVEAAGRRLGGQARRVELLLPGPNGVIERAPVEQLGRTEPGQEAARNPIPAEMPGVRPLRAAG